MTTHTAQPRPPTSTAINYTGDTTEVQTALTAATPEGATWAYTVTADGDTAHITLTYGTAEMSTDVHVGEWVVYLGTTIDQPTLPEVLTDEAMHDTYIIDAPAHDERT